MYSNYVIIMFYIQLCLVVGDQEDTKKNSFVDLHNMLYQKYCITALVFPPIMLFVFIIVEVYILTVLCAQLGINK